mmetsp:Transcript_21161/g.32299  ORF Transcript_21161/g.32299 Transcript_21161/m.32299 type:complete len:640 (-) Transcript_21161:29-1948(-)
MTGGGITAHSDVYCITMAPPSPSSNHAAVLSANESSQARHLANSVASWYLATLDPYAPHSQNVELRLRHPVHVVTRCILYGNIGGIEAGGTEELEALFNDDDAEIKDGGPETLTRRSAARMEAFLASCADALRADDDPHHDEPRELADEDGKDTIIKKTIPRPSATPTRATSTASSSKTPKIHRQIEHGELLLRLDLYCRTLRRIRSIADYSNGTKQLQECIIQCEPKKSIRSRARLIIQTFLGNVDCVRDVHKTLMSLILKATLEVLAVEIWCEELSTTVDRLASEYEHKVSFGSLAFLSSPDSSVETHLAPLLTKYFEYLQMNWESLVSKCEIERMLRAVLDRDLRFFFKNAVFHSVGHILDVCRDERGFLDNIALPPPWKEGVFGNASGGDSNKDMDAAINSYCSDAALVSQALRDLRREVITVNGQILSPAHDVPELAEYLGQILNSSQVKKSLGETKGSILRSSRRRLKKRVSNYTSDFGLESESDFFSGGESDSSVASKVDVGLVDVLARRLLIAASRTGAGGDAYFVVRDLFGGDEVEVVPHHSSGRVNQGTIEIIVKMTSAIMKSHAKFDIFAKPCGDSDPLIQFHTTTTETLTLQQSVDGSTVLLKEKKTKMTGWKTLAIRPAYYEKITA